MKRNTIYLAERTSCCANHDVHICAFSVNKTDALIRQYGTQKDKPLIIKQNLMDFQESCDYIIETQLPSFDNNDRYWNQFIQNVNMNNEPLRNLAPKKIYEISRKIILDDEQLYCKMIKSTDLRKLYEDGGRSLPTQNDEIADNLASLFFKAIDDLSYYNNINEEFILAEDSRIQKRKKDDKTIRLQDYMKSKQQIPLDTDHYLLYVGRELAPLRTTNGFSSDGKSSKKSGAGGVDIICINNKNQISLIEYKSETDKSLQYALIQILTYGSELSTHNQKSRLFKQFPTVDTTKLGLCLMFDLTKKREEELDSFRIILPRLQSKIRNYIDSISLVGIQCTNGIYEFKLIIEES